MSGGQITQRTVADAKYALACLKESLRLHPVAVGTGRQLQKVQYYYQFKQLSVVHVYRTPSSVGTEFLLEPS